MRFAHLSVAEAFEQEPDNLDFALRQPAFPQESGNEEKTDVPGAL
jgi:hypothetical protein